MVIKCNSPINPLSVNLSLLYSAGSEMVSSITQWFKKVYQSSDLPND